MPLPTDPIDPQALILAGKTAKALSTVVKSPSFWQSFQGFGEGVAMVGSALAKGFGIAMAFKDIKDEWQDSNIHLGVKIASSVVKIGYISVASIGLVGTLGVTLIASPVIAVVVGGVSLFRNLGDLGKEALKTRKIKQDMKELQAKLDKHKLDFERNNTLRQDIRSSLSEIAELEARKQDIDVSLAMLKSGKVSESDLEDVAASRSHSIQDDIGRSEIIKRNADKIIALTQEQEALEERLKTAPKDEQVDLKKQLQEIEIKLESKKFEKQVYQAPKRITSLSLAKAKLEKRRKKLSKQGENSPAYVENESKISKLEKKIEKATVLCKFNQSCVTWHHERSQLIKELAKLDKKYESYKPEVREKLKALNAQYLESRIEELSGLLEKATDSRLVQKEHDESLDVLKGQKEELDNALNNPQSRSHHLRSALQEALEEESQSLTSKIEIKQKAYKKKAQYTRLFLNREGGIDNNLDLDAIYHGPITSKAKQENALQAIKAGPAEGLQLQRSIKQDAADIMKLEAQVGQKNIILKTQKIVTRKRQKNVLLAAITIGLAITAFVFPPAAIAVSVGLLLVGVVAGVSNISDHLAKKGVEKEAKEFYAKDVNQCLKSLDEDMRGADNALKSERTQSLDATVKSIVNHEIFDVAEHFIPNSEQAAGASQRVIDLLDGAVDRILAHDEVARLSVDGQKKLKAYLERPSTIDRVYKRALHARVDHFYDKLVKGDHLNQEVDGLNWIKYPRARREVIQKMYERAVNDHSRFDSPAKKDRSLTALKAIYVEAIKQDLAMMPLELAHRFLETLKTDPLFNSSLPNSEELSNEQIAKNLNSLVLSRTKSEDLSAIDDFSKTSPAFDISHGLLTRLSESMKAVNDNLDNWLEHPEDIDCLLKLVSHKHNHCQLIERLKELSPDERLEKMDDVYQAIMNENNTEQQRPSQKFSDMEMSDSAISLIGRLQKLGLETLEESVQAIVKSRENKTDPQSISEAMLDVERVVDKIKNNPVMKVNITTEQSQTLDIAILKIKQKAEVVPIDTQSGPRHSSAKLG